MEKNKKKKELIKKNEKKNFLALIGERIKIIRLDEKINQGEMEEKLGLSKLTLHRIEFGVGGTIPALLLILEHLSSLGYNLRWILEKDNRHELKKKDQLFTIEIEKDKIKNTVEIINQKLEELNNIISKI